MIRNLSFHEACQLIRRWQPRCMSLGYYIALAGGILNNGTSGNDLDLVLMPRTKDSRPDSVLAYLQLCLGPPVAITAVPGGMHYRFEPAEVLPVELTIVQP